MSELTDIQEVVVAGPIGVVGASPLAVEGLRQALASAAVGELVALDGQATDTALQTLVVYVGSARQIEQVRALRRARPSLPMVAVVPDELWCRVVLEAGASSALRTSTSPDEFVQVIRSCVDGHPLLPTELAVAVLRAGSVSDPSWEDLCMIDGLARGERVRSLAGRLGYSERHLHRRLKELYRRLMVRDRSGAVAAARELGWIPATAGGGGQSR